MALSTTFAELLAKLPAHVGAKPRAEPPPPLQPSVSTSLEYVDRILFQMHLTESRIDTEVLINATTITDIDVERVQSQTSQAAVVPFTHEELELIQGAEQFLIDLADAAMAKLATERAAIAQASLPSGPDIPPQEHIPLPVPPPPV